MKSRLSRSGGIFVFIHAPFRFAQALTNPDEQTENRGTKSGRLSEKSLELLKQCGIKLSNGDRKLKAEAVNFPLEILFLRDDDIPQYVEQGVADIGILGENEVLEQGKDVQVLEKLGFAGCRLSLAIPRDEVYTGLSGFRTRKSPPAIPVFYRHT